jgi:hypothetical protein
VGSLDLDTSLTGGDGRYVTTISPDWKIWGPNGGYMAAFALRAAGTASRFQRPRASPAISSASAPSKQRTSR